MRWPWQRSWNAAPCRYIDALFNPLIDHVVATLVECRPMSVLDEPAARCRKTPKAVAWVLENIRCIKKPFPVQGELGVFEVDETGLLDLAESVN